jgi:putative ABC transport system permease protein
LLLVRTNPRSHASIVAYLRSVGHTMFPDADEVRVTQLSQLIDRDLRPWRLGAALFTAMGVLAAVIAALGIYSVFSYAVSQRTREFGIRIALGAQLADTLRDVLGEGLRVVVVSAVVGVGLALALGRLVGSLLYGVAPYDPSIMLGGVAVLALLGVAGTLVPALRAGRVDPVTVLRSE